jgi:hypothetical protein
MGEPAPALVPWLQNQLVLSGYFGLTPWPPEILKKN